MVLASSLSRASTDKTKISLSKSSTSTRNVLMQSQELERFFMCIQGQHGKDITHQGLSGKIYPTGRQKLFGKATKKERQRIFNYSLSLCLSL